MQNPVVSEDHERITVNVGGRIFETTYATLTRQSESHLARDVAQRWKKAHPSYSGNSPSYSPTSPSYVLPTQIAGSNSGITKSPLTIFIDRNPDAFAGILELLRTGRNGNPNSPPRGVSEQEWHLELQFYGIKTVYRDILQKSIITKPAKRDHNTGGDEDEGDNKNPEDQDDPPRKSPKHKNRKGGRGASPSGLGRVIVNN